MFSIDYLKGKNPLFKAFWYYWCLIPLVTIIVVVSICTAINIYVPSFFLPAVYVSSILFFLANTYGLIVTWQCAWNVKRPIWSWLVIGIIFLCVYPGTSLNYPLPDNTFFHYYTVFLNCVRLSILLLAVIAIGINGKIINNIYYVIVPVLLTILLALTHLTSIIYEFKFPAFANLTTGEYSEFYWPDFNSYNVNAKIKKMLKVLEEKAVYGDSNAAYMLSSAYSDKDFRDDSKAFNWAKFASDHGNIYAKNSLGIYYEVGTGVKKDPAMTLRLFKEASEAGYYVSTYNLGLKYEEGIIVPRDYKLAAYYYQKSIDQGQPSSEVDCASNDLGAFYATGKGVNKDDQKALALFKNAAMKNLIIELPANYKIKTSADFGNFTNAFANYRLAISQGKPISSLKLSPEMLAATKVVADYYYDQCRE